MSTSTNNRTPTPSLRTSNSPSSTIAVPNTLIPTSLPRAILKMTQDTIPMVHSGFFAAVHVLTLITFVLLLFSMSIAPRGRDTDTESDLDYQHRGGVYTPSAESLPSPRFGQSDVSTPTFGEQALLMGGEAYPTWTTDKQIPISKEEVSIHVS